MRRVAYVALAATAAEGRRGEVWSAERAAAAGVKWRGNRTRSPLPHEYLTAADVPDELTWCNKDG
eukprot:gene3356-4716_t